MPGWLEHAVERLRGFAYGGRRVRPGIGLALGGGFARGIAHLGVLRVLEQNNISIGCIAGTSAGALIGIAYASGQPIEQIVRQAAATRFRDFGHWKLSWMGLATNYRMDGYLRRYLRVTSFADLKLPLAIAATDLDTGDAVFFREGPLGPALRASCAYPGVFCPVEYQGRLLVDGFLAAAVPVAAAREMGAEIVIAVFLQSDSVERPTGALEIVERSFSILQRYADLQWRKAADVIIEPDVRKFGWDDFEKTPQLVAAGEEAARAALPKIHAAIEAARKKHALHLPDARHEHKD
ncbi:MAG TPA: patatin-like phospholipase family protein [Methylomirabilota bacterium]|nr:patatin-like phospholipase family protein [Methylomirabilota bacterium]